MRSKRHRLRVLIRKLISPILKWLYIKYTSKQRSYTYKDMSIEIFPGVFPPRFFHTTHFILEYLQKQDIGSKSFLEIGAGSGLVSIYAAKQKAKVTATDISEIAIQNVKENAKSLDLKITVTKSDLFKKIRKKKFEWIVINPPFYPNNPKNDPEHAWYCGENYEYFHNLFEQIGNYMNEKSHIIMVLTDTAPIKQIIYIAGKNDFIMGVERIKKHLLERSFIFTIKKALQSENLPK
ncbi:MAG: methyltransferase domain-containing protein [Calditrichaeota bacterium]|nr:MAG: methyltransferase domain-containing protein [Calditrichota bacterium]MBL1206643.1 methyltransferase domain-containing protein [Calditrichota bacterium]NOG46470.1 methyltransferase [Calditrichota bacterium]